MKHMRRMIRWGVWSLWVAGLVPAGAFPDWMGVFGSAARHDGRNPGQFQIMMNEDYFGLQANMGVRVNGGDWQEVAMNYHSHADGNSVWTYTPGEPFPFGSEIEFYFHGFEGDSHIYDSADSANYHSGPLFWSAPADTGLVSAYPGNGYGKVRICAAGKDLFGAHALSILQMSRKPVGEDWQVVNYPLEDSGITDFALAGQPGAWVVARVIGTNLATRFSADGGETFSAPVALATQPDGAIFAGLGVAAGAAAGEFGLVYGLATNCCGAQQVFFTRTTDGGATWSEPVVALDTGDGTAFYSWMELGHNADGWLLAARRVLGSSHLMQAAHSADGAVWTTVDLGGNRAWSEPDLCLSSNVAAIAADPFYDDYIRVWRHQGGNWSTQDVVRTLESGRTVRMGTDGLGRWHVFRQVDNNAGWLWSSFLSRDDALTWTTNRALANPAVPHASDNFTIEQVVNAGAKQYVLWHADYYIGMYQRMHAALLQKSDGYEERIDNLLWAGSSYTVVMTNLAPGATIHLEGSDSIVAQAWTNIATWTGTAPGTNRTGTAGTQGYFRVRSDR
jgi:hypothetical protein